MKKVIFLKTLLFFVVVQLSTINITTAQTSTTTVLFQNSSQYYKDIRKSNGTYLDALSLNGATDKPAAIVAAGVGLMYLCISDAMRRKSGDSGNWQYTSGQVIRTLDTFISFRTNGKTNAAGMFPRYFNYLDGNQQGDWSYEYSTMDNAIFAMGLIMCKNYFSTNSRIKSKVTSLLGTMDFTKAINTSNIALVLDNNGNGVSYTQPFNEYMLVSWLANNAKSTNPGLSKSQTFWNTYFANPLNSPAPVSRPNYFGVTTLSDGAGWQSSFVPQFCYYFVSYYKSNTDYMNFHRDWLTIDKDYSFRSGATDRNEWGLGAGEIPGGGYSADKVESNTNGIVSPHIIAGFIPINATGSKDNLKYLYDNNKGVYSLPSNTSKKVLWRYIRTNSTQQADYIQAIDYSTMLFGLASLSEHLGVNWFSNYNNPAGSGLKRLADSDLEEPLDTAASFIYPNPFSDSFTITVKEKGNTVIRIMDLTGKEVFHDTMNETEKTLFISNQFSSGIYTVEINNNGILSYNKLIKN